MSTFLEEMIAAVGRIKRDYPDVPVRFEFAPDVWRALNDVIPLSTMSVRDKLTGLSYPNGVPCVVNHADGPGEWGPVFRCSPPPN
jgi:hypothetical protein